MTFLVRCLRHIGWPLSAMRPRADYQNRVSSLVEACARLPEPARSVYLLSARDRCSFEAIARQLDLSVASVECELAKALALLDEEDIAVTSPPVGS